MVILGANLGYRLHPLQHYEYKETNKQKIGSDIVMGYIKVICKQIYIEMFVSRTKWQMQSGANTLYASKHMKNFRCVWALEIWEDPDSGLTCGRHI